MKKLQLFIAPSSDTENEYEDLIFEECVEKAKELKDGSARVFSFDSEKDMNFFIRGYQTGVGYLGNGYWIKNI